MDFSMFLIWGTEGDRSSETRKDNTMAQRKILKTYDLHFSCTYLSRSFSNQ
jgi:hypothetical protein